MKQIFRTVGYAASFALLGGGASQAADESAFMLDTTGDLVTLCAAQPGDPNYAAAVHMCQGYLLGVHHFHTALAHEVDEDIYCVDPNKTPPSRDEVVAAFVAWSQAHPELADKEALEGLLTWAGAAFPCS